jgi:hypothetical protein
MHASLTKSQRERSQIHHKKFAKKRLRKSPKNEKWERDHQALRNHAESSILPRRFIQGLACLPSSIPLSRSHHEALKLVLEISKENGRGK